MIDTVLLEKLSQVNVLPGQLHGLHCTMEDGAIAWTRPWSIVSVVMLAKVSHDTQISQVVVIV